MRVHIATDHAAFELKQFLVEQLSQDGYEVIDHGAHEYDALDDYPVFCIPCAEAVVAEKDEGAMGIVLGGSGNGEQLAANRVRGARAILAPDVERAQLGREHNNANIVSLGGRFVDDAGALEIVRAFLQTPFPDEERHARRVRQMETYETDGSI